MASRPHRLTLPSGVSASLLTLALIGSLAVSLLAHGRDAAASTVDHEEYLALDLVNDERAAHGLLALAFSASLQAAAEWMSFDQAQHDILRHDDSLGRGLRPRLSDFGYPSNTGIWENVAAGDQLDAVRVVPLWIDSPPHLDNILAPNARAAGLARAQIDDGRWYWTLDLGSSLSDEDRLTVQSAAPQAAAQTWALVGWSGPDLDVATAATVYGWTSAVFSWDPAAAAFDAYFGALPSALNSLRTLRAGHAYWVELDQTAAEPLLPASPAVAAIELDRGLNLVSWLGPAGVTLAEAAQSIGPGLLTAWAWDFATQSYVAYSPLLPVGLANYSLGTGSGLWVSVDRPISWQQSP